MKKQLLLFLFLITIPWQTIFAQENKILKDKEKTFEAKETSEKHQILSDRFHFEIGLFVPSKKIKIGANGSVPNQDYDFGNSFHLNDNESTLFLHFEWYFTKKWKFSVENFSIKNANKVELEEDIIWEDIVFKEGSSVRAGYGINLYRIYVGRTFSKGLKHEFGAGLGVHALNTNVFIEGNAVINNDEIKFERRNVSAIIPLPNIGLWYYYAPNSKWAFIARMDWFSLTIGEYSGSLYDIASGIKYQVFKNIGVGVDYRYFFVKAHVNNLDWNGEFNMGFNGPLISVHANF